MSRLVRGRTMPSMLRTAPLLAVLALTACGAAAIPAQADAAKRPPRLDDLMRDYDLRLSVQMRSKFAFQPKPDGCPGSPPTPTGHSGSGEEILEMRSARPVRVTLYTPPDDEPSVSRKDLKPTFPVSGTSRRSGQITFIACGEATDLNAEGCTGKFPIRDNLGITFHRGTWQIDGEPSPSTREQIRSCTDKNIDWDGAVARTGTVLLQDARGKAARSKLKTKGSFSLTARTVEKCDVDYFGLGTCSTEWNYKATFTRVKAKKRRR